MRKCGSYCFWSDGENTVTIIFNVNPQTFRPTFIVMGNTSASPFIALYSVANLTADLQKVNPCKIYGPSENLNVLANADGGDFSKLRIRIVTPSGVGSLVQVIVPNGNFSYNY